MNLQPRPLDPLRSIRTKLGVVILAAVAVTVLVVEIGVFTGIPWWLTGPAAGALALVMVKILSRGMTSPLREMAAAAQAMARGSYGMRVTETSRDEVGDLARAFNAMAADLAEVDRMRRDLIANVSHELRTPITALQAVLENLVDGVEPPDPARFRTMLKQVERLGRLVAQLLDLSRLESGATQLQRQTFHVRPLLQQVVDEARLSAEDVDVDLICEPEDLLAEADPERVHQVVANLVSNAVRHSPTRGRVGVGARPERSGVRIEVTDEGPGIPEGEASRVFERFYRADAARSSADGGSGLGLAIARWIVDLHGGQIHAEQADPKGCRMVVDLPGEKA